MLFKNLALYEKLLKKQCQKNPRQQPQIQRLTNTDESSANPDAQTRINASVNRRLVDISPSSPDLACCNAIAPVAGCAKLIPNPVNSCEITAK